MDSNRFGERGEALAAAYLEGRGWTVLDRNWRFHHKEIDLVVERGGVVAFVEVKARTAGAWDGALGAITARKRRDLAIAARGWIVSRGRGYATFRFDAVTVSRCRTRLRVEHIEDAWRL